MRNVLMLVVGLLVAGPARAEPVRFPGPEGITLQGELFHPEGAAHGPAVVALHGCGGPFASRDAMWRKILTDAGHVVLFPNSFASRGLGSQCRETKRVATASGLRRQDAIAAAQYLAATEPSAREGVVLLGWSDGGSTVLATASAGRADLPAGLFRRFIAFYPGCRGFAASATWAPAAPLSILQGEADDWTPFAPCRDLASRAPGVSLTGFPGAYHDFDAPVPIRVQHNIPTSQNPDHSVHAGGDDAARAEAVRQVLALLAQR